MFEQEKTPGVAPGVIEKDGSGNSYELHNSLAVSQTEGITFARHLAENGVPIFLAERSENFPKGGSDGRGYRLPKRWHQTKPDPSVLDDYKPGMAVCAVMGHTVDAVDKDPRNGGDLEAAFQPKVYGSQSTPSGGTHDLVASLGVRSRDGILPGIDVKAGLAKSGEGMGFIFIAPTERPVHGSSEVKQYEWIHPPNLDTLALVGEHSGAPLAGLINGSREPSAAEDYVGPAYDDLEEGKRVQARQAQEDRIQSWRELLADSKDWPDDHRDPRGRGWEALARDFAWSVASMAANPWMPMTAEQAETVYKKLLPDELATTDECQGKFYPGLVDKTASKDIEQPPWADFEAADAENPPDGDGVLQRYPATDWHALWDKNTDEEWIISPLLAARRSVAIYSAPKVGKSLIMLEIAAAVASGTEVLGTTPDPRRVLYVDFENDPTGDVIHRLKNMGYRPDQLDNLKHLSYPTFPAFDSEQGSRELLAAVDAHRCEVIVIDTVSRSIEGDENENTTWLQFYRHTGMKLKQAEVAVVRLDHSGKDSSKGQRGGSAKGGDVDAVWHLSEIAKDTTFQLECEMHRMPVGESKLILQRETSPVLYHRVIGHDPHEARVQNVITLLDAHGHPPSMPVRQARDFLTEKEVKASNIVVSAAVKRRKDRDDFA